jgi:hypothetical protein
MKSGEAKRKPPVFYNSSLTHLVSIFSFCNGNPSQFHAADGSDQGIVEGCAGGGG